MNTTNTFWANIAHIAAQGIVWVVPLFLLTFPKVGDLTISAVLSFIVSYFNNQYHLGK